MQLVRSCTNYSIVHNCTNCQDGNISRYSFGRIFDQHDYRKKYDGYASRYAALESREDRQQKERERKEIQYDIFGGFLAGLRETDVYGNLRGIEV